MSGALVFIDSTTKKPVWVSDADPLPVTGGGGGGGGAVTVADGADVTQGAIADAAWTGSGNATVVAALKGIYAALGVPIPGLQATGSLGALNANVELVLGGAAGFVVDLRGTFTATVTFQGTIDGTNWFTIAVLPAGGSVNVASVTTATAAGAWAGSATGFLRVRAIATAYTSGPVTVVIRAVQNPSINLTMPSGATSQTVAVGSALPTGANTIGAVNIAAAQTLATVTTVTNLTNMPKLGQTTRTPVWASGQTFTTSTTSARSSAITGTEVMISTDVDAYINIGTSGSVTATVGAGSLFIAKGGPYTFQITTGQAVAAILASGTGRITLLPVA
jgi:hypothetical protein